MSRADLNDENAAAEAAHQARRNMLLEEQRAAVGEARVRAALLRLSEQRYISFTQERPDPPPKTVTDRADYCLPGGCNLTILLMIALCVPASCAPDMRSFRSN